MDLAIGAVWIGKLCLLEQLLSLKQIDVDRSVMTDAISKRIVCLPTLIALFITINQVSNVIIGVVELIT